MVNENDTITNETKHDIESTSSVPFPPFWNAMPDIWFCQIEAIFKIKKILKDENKYHHTISCLPVDIISSVSDVLKNVPEDDKYNTLKNAILKRKSMSEVQRLEQLLEGSAIGDRSPSQFYRDMQTTAGGSAMSNEQLLKALWLKRLPDQMRAIIAVRESEKIDTLCDLADKIWEISSSSSSNISAVQTPYNNTLNELNKTIEELRSRLSKFENNFSNDNRSRNHSGTSSYRSRRNSYSRSNSRSRNNSASWRNDTNTKNPCWYHWQYGKNAKKCHGGSCTFTSNLNSEN